MPSVMAWPDRLVPPERNVSGTPVAAAAANSRPTSDASRGLTTTVGARNSARRHDPGPVGPARGCAAVPAPAAPAAAHRAESGRRVAAGPMPPARGLPPAASLRETSAHHHPSDHGHGLLVDQHAGPEQQAQAIDLVEHLVEDTGYPQGRADDTALAAVDLLNRLAGGQSVEWVAYCAASPPVPMRPPVQPAPALTGEVEPLQFGGRRPNCCALRRDPDSRCPPVDHRPRVRAVCAVQCPAAGARGRGPGPVLQRIVPGGRLSRRAPRPAGPVTGPSSLRHRRAGCRGAPPASLRPQAADSAESLRHEGGGTGGRAAGQMALQSESCVTACRFLGRNRRR